MIGRGLLIGIGVAITGLAAVPASPVIATPDAVAATRSGSGTVQLVLPLQARYAALRRFATAVSTPGSRLYGHYEPLPRLERRFGASMRTRAAVERYLRAHGARQVRADSTGFFVDATMRLATAERLFGGAAAARERSRVRLPAGLHGLATGVVGLDTQPVVTSAAATATATTTTTAPATRTATASDSPSGYQPATGTPSGCSAAEAVGGFTPNQYLTAYGYTAVHRQNLHGTGETVALIEIDGFRHSDITTFARCFALHVPKIVAYGVGFHKPLAPGPESTLDLEVLDAAAPDLKRVDVYESRSDSVSVLKALTAPLQKSQPKPQAISISLGLCERDLRYAVSAGGIRASSAALKLAAASGISILSASGDSGSSDCQESSSGGGSGPAPVLAVNYPSSSPWVTAVGGTNIALDSANQITDQVVWNDAEAAPGDAGGGGFSSIFKRPGYQRGTVARDQRAVPDVAMLADVAPGYDIYCTAGGGVCGHGWEAVGGTSAATPLLAAGFALLDQDLRRRRREPLGLANPLLYTLGRDAATRAKVFDDVTVGDDDVIPYTDPEAGMLSCCTARVGFDEASGWGSVNLAAFKTQALARQPKLRPKKTKQKKKKKKG